MMGGKAARLLCVSSFVGRGQGMRGLGAAPFRRQGLSVAKSPGVPPSEVTKALESLPHCCPEPPATSTLALPPLGLLQQIQDRLHTAASPSLASYQTTQGRSRQPSACASLWLGPRLPSELVCACRRRLIR